MGKKFTRLLQWVWRALKWAGQVWSIVAMFGWVPVVIGVVGGAIAFMQSLSPLLIFFSIVGGYTLGITAVNQRQAYRQRRQQRPQDINKRKTERIEHDGVLWEYTGRRSAWTNALLAEGPLCPKDYCLLSLRSHGYSGVHEEVRADYHDDELISKGNYGSILFCQECKEEYSLGEEGKTIQQSRQEVETLFEAKHRREANAKET